MEETINSEQESKDGINSDKKSNDDGSNFLPQLEPIG